MVKHPWPLLEISLSGFHRLATLNINTYLPGGKMGSVDCWAGVGLIFHVLLHVAVFAQLALECNPLVFQLTAKRLASSLIIHEVPKYTSLFRFSLS